MSDAVAGLRAIVGASHVLADLEQSRSYNTDWTGRWEGQSLAVVRPGTTAEVQAVVELCHKHQIGVVPQGGNTGLVGGSIPQNGSIVLSTLRLNQIGAPDPYSGQITAGAGATIAAVNAVAGTIGRRYGVDFAARDSATVGGSIATNAGGHHVLRFGMTRQQVVGIEAVLGDATVVSHLAGLAKDNTGYDLPGLLCGSEGTLGVITAARLTLVPRFQHYAVALVGLEDLAAAVDAIQALRLRLGGLEALEIMFPPALRVVASMLDATLPITESPVTLLVEVAGDADPMEGLADQLGALNGVVDTAVGTDVARRADLWRWRDLHSEAVSQIGRTPPHKLDVTVPVGAFPAFIPALEALVKATAPRAELWLFGHGGDGNLHVNITGLAPDDANVDEVVLELVARYGGSISAEHGIGRAKRQWLHLNRSPAELAAFRAIKAALDPKSILNPGVLIPD